jgi:hypothetical protein
VTLPNGYDSPLGTHKSIVTCLFIGGIIAIGLFFGILQIVRSNTEFPVMPISTLAGLVAVMAVIGLGGLFLRNNKRWKSF